MLLLELPDGWTAQRSWIAVTLLRRLDPALQLAPYAGADWRLSVPGRPGAIRLPDDFFVRATALGSLGAVTPHDPCPFLHDEVDEGSVRIPILFGQAEPPAAPAEAGQDYRFDLDLFGSAFWMLTRLEEDQAVERDAHDRFSARASHAWRNGYLMTPWVDEAVLVLKALMRRVWPGLTFAKSGFRQIPTHDVDDPFAHRFMGTTKALRLLAANAVKARSLGMGIRLAGNYLGAQLGLDCADPCDTFDWLMTQSEQAGLTSRFYFIPTRGSRPVDAEYALMAPPIRRLMQAIHERGHEIGIHPSYDSYRDPALIATEMAALRAALTAAGIGQADVGGRMHYLRWHHASTPQAQAAAGFAYDSSLGFADHPGFRCGTCHEFDYFDLTNGCATTLRMRPLIAMECTVMAKRYLGLGVSDAAHAMFTMLKERCRRVEGSFVLLWHNSYLFQPEERALYAAVLAH